MLFNEFATILRPVLAGDATNGEYVRNLFTNITSFSDDIDSNPIDELSEQTLRCYLNGTRSISKIARKINKYVDDEEFVSYINSLNDGATESICNILKPYCPHITNFNSAKECASLLKSILLDSVNNTFNNTISKNKSTLPSNKANIQNEHGLTLLIESKGVCPQDNCCQMLYTSKDGKSIMNYEITQIDADLSLNSFDNLIALCHKCSGKYKLSTNKNEIKRLTQIKRKLQLECDTMETLSNSHIESSIKKALDKIQNTNPKELISLNFTPVALEEKFLEENFLLLMKIKSYVSLYYNYVNSLFKQLNKEGKLRFESFCIQVKFNYINLRDKGLSQENIYNSLVDWLMTNTNENRLPCEIIISYFVQKCEVFDVITK